MPTHGAAAATTGETGSLKRRGGAVLQRCTGTEGPCRPLGIEQGKAAKPDQQVLNQAQTGGTAHRLAPRQAPLAGDRVALLFSRCSRCSRCSPQIRGHRAADRTRKHLPLDPIDAACAGAECHAARTGGRDQTRMHTTRWDPFAARLRRPARTAGTSRQGYRNLPPGLLECPAAGWFCRRDSGADALAPGGSGPWSRQRAR